MRSTKICEINVLGQEGGLEAALVSLPYVPELNKLTFISAENIEHVKY